MKNLVASLIKFQREVPAIPKNKLNPHFKSKYAELSVCLDVCLPVLNKHGLAVIQLMKAEDGKNKLVTMLCHESGEALESYVYLPDIQDAQKLTAAITYLRRASFLSAVGLVAEDDLDGNDVVEAPKQYQAVLKQVGQVASDAQKGLMRKLKIQFNDDVTKDEANALIKQYNEGKK